MESKMPANSTENTKNWYIRAIPIKTTNITHDRQQKEKHKPSVITYLVDILFVFASFDGI